MAIEFFFCYDFVNASNLSGNFLSLKSSSFLRYLSAFVILAGWWSAGCENLTVHHLKHSLSLIFEC